MRSWAEKFLRTLSHLENTLVCELYEFLNKKAYISFYTIFNRIFLPSSGELIGIEYLYFKTGEGATDFREADTRWWSRCGGAKPRAFWDKLRIPWATGGDAGSQTAFKVRGGSCHIDLYIYFCYSWPLNIPSEAEYRQMMAQSVPGNRSFKIRF